jgi:membrane protein implicated in regulation of membrane protease activity
MWSELGEFFSDRNWAASWFSLALLLGTAELMSMELVLLMVALGAAGGGIAALLGAPVWLALLVAIVVSSATLTLARPPMVARLHRGPDLRTGHAALEGATAVVVEEVSEMSGRVKLSGELWSARAYDPTEVIVPGTKVRVFSIDGATAVVHPD